jgi:hypothetical protein
MLEPDRGIKAAAASSAPAALGRHKKDYQRGKVTSCHFCRAGIRSPQNAAFLAV